MGGNVARRGEVINAYKVLIAKPEGKSPLGRPRRRCENNIKVACMEIGFGAWIGFIRLRMKTGNGHL
jgi:hypothetical protein